MRYSARSPFALSLLPLCGLIGTMSISGHRAPSPPQSAGYVVFFAPPLPRTDGAHVCELQAVLRTIRRCRAVAEPSASQRRYRARQITQYNQIARETTPAARRRAGLPDCLR